MRRALLPLLLFACTDDPVQEAEPEVYADDDQDGYTADIDCDDGDPTIHPDADEACDNVDNDCDGELDEGLAEEWFPDDDEDGFGSASTSVMSCARPAGHVPNTGDCDDSDAFTFPGANEYCDGIDNDCDGQADPTACRPLESSEVRLDGQGAGHEVGHRVAGLGDLDRDGFGDFAVGAPASDPLGYAGGAAWFFDGPVAEGATLDDAVATFYGGVLGEYAGWDVAGAGDVDGDGLGDVLVGAWGEPSAGSEAGATYLLLGPLSGTLMPEDAAARLRGEATGDSSGQAVAGVGDRTGDGLPDLLIGAPNADDAGFSSGAAYLISGAVAGTVSLRDAHSRIAGDTEADRLGAAVTGTGDLDGDGLDDLAIAAPGDSEGGEGAGAVYVFLDPPVGRSIAAETADIVLVGGARGDQAGAALGRYGDFNGDGYSAFLVGAADQSEGGAGAGAAYVVAGPLTASTDLNASHARIIGRLPQDHAGNAVDVAGDVDGDGELDLIIGAYIEDSGGLNAGAAYLVNGPITGTRYLTDANAGFIGEAESDLAGWSAAGAGDVDGDGLGDVLVGAPKHDLGGDDAGVAYLIYAAGL
jgi:hypothetical protein